MCVGLLSLAVVVSIWSICTLSLCYVLFMFFFFQAEDGIRDLVRSRGLGDVYKRQTHAGDIALTVPKLRAGSFFPSILSPRRGGGSTRPLSLIHI